MPNWANVNIDVVLPKDNNDKLLELFLDWDNDDKNIGKDRYLARTFIYGEPYEVQSVDEANIKLSIACMCAWSIYSCWIDGYPREHDCPTIEEICHELNIVELDVKASEMGLFFVEDLYWSKDSDGIIYDCQDLDRELFIERFGQDEWEDYCIDQEDGSEEQCKKAYDIYINQYYNHHDKDNTPVCYDEFYNNEWQDDECREYYEDIIDNQQKNTQENKQGDAM